MPIALIVSTKESNKDLSWDSFDGVLLPIDPINGFETTLKFLPRPFAEEVRVFSKKYDFKSKPKSSFSFDSITGRRIVVSALPKGKLAFDLLEWARKTLKPFSNSKKIVADFRLLGEKTPLATDAIVSALVAADYELPRYRVKKSAKVKPPKDLTIACFSPHKEAAEASLLRAQITTEATNLVRRLANMAGNDLTSSHYVALATQIGRDYGLSTDFLSLKRLAQLKAGAFLAVTQGSEDKGGGILKLVYEPKAKGARKVALVGKGITYDTGGTNLKTGGHMFGMHQDMTGSAVALATTIVAAREKWPYRIEAYLAITDNLLSPRSYRPNDVVTSMKGITIEVVDTDAEGRMVLADTLYLASKEKPDLVMDFATLTGTCVRALGHHYSGGFTNRRRLFQKMILAGRKSGERVWPFPNDPDYVRCLKSEVADIKQCRLTGGTDHIEASLFLKRFLAPKVPWVHVDLSAANPEEGLAHIPGKTSGFGVRFAVAFIESFFV